MRNQKKAIEHLLDLVKEKRLIIDNEGNLTRILKNGKKKEINTVCQGYKVIVDKNISVYQHRLLYAYYHGIDSLDDNLTINHIDYNKTNNRKENLEQISKGDNTRHGVKSKTLLLEKNSNCNLGRILKEKGRIKKWVAKKIDVDYVILNNYISGKEIIPIDKAIKLGELIGIDINEIYDINPY